MPRVSIIMRSKNDEKLIDQTLQAVFSQKFKDFELINIDSGSTDSTVEIIKKYPTTLLQIPAEQYNPGLVLNLAIEKAKGDYLVFLNSDATPINEEWLENLIKPLTNGYVAAVYGRQIPRPEATPLVRNDYERAFGDGSFSGNWYHFFSLANSAIKKKLWEVHPFSTKIQYSEDVEWSYWAKKQGYVIKYVPEAIVTHSHNYSLKELYKRQFGEGKAEAAIFDWSGWKVNAIRYAILPYFAEVIRDLIYCLPRREFKSMFWSIPYRLVEKFGRYRGFQKGRREKSELHYTPR